MSELLPIPSGWPEPPASDAYYGLTGDIVTTIAPHTEADPVAVLVQLLVACGALIGRGAWFEVEATRHYANEFAVLVGDSALSRKGSALGHVKRLLGEVEEDFPSRMKKGLSSGEGVVWLLRDRNGKDAGSLGSSVAGDGAGVREGVERAGTVVAFAGVAGGVGRRGSGDVDA